MAKYRRKPLIFEAFQMTKERRHDNSEWPEWLHKAWNLDSGTKGSLYCKYGSAEIYCGTLEGEHLVSWNDFIIQGVEGEIYPCKPDNFGKTYEAIK